MRAEARQKLNILSISEHFGGMPRLAEALGICVQAIYQWESIPVSRAYQIEVLTRGRFKASELLKQ